MEEMAAADQAWQAQQQQWAGQPMPPPQQHQGGGQGAYQVTRGPQGHTPAEGAQFAANGEEIRQIPESIKHRALPCRNFNVGNCNWGHSCCFAHSEEELHAWNQSLKINPPQGSPMLRHRNGQPSYHQEQGTGKMSAGGGGGGGGQHPRGHGPQGGMGAPMMAQPAPAVDTGFSLLVAELDTSITDKALYETFISTQDVKSARVVVSTDATIANYGFVYFHTKSIAADVLANWNGHPIPNMNGKLFKLSWGEHSNMVNNNKRALEKPQLPPPAMPPVAAKPVAVVPTKPTTLLLSELGPEVDEPTIFHTFQQYYPSICNCKVIVDPATGVSKGFGFVSFKLLAEAQRALAQMQGFQIGSKKIRLIPEPGGAKRQNTGAPPAAAAAPVQAAALPAVAGELSFVQVFQLAQKARAGIARLGLDVLLKRSPESKTVMLGPGLAFEGASTAAGWVDALKAAFAPFGTVSHAAGYPGNQVGLVQMETRAEAEAAFAKLHKTKLGKKLVKCCWCANQVADKPVVPKAPAAEAAAETAAPAKEEAVAAPVAAAPAAETPAAAAPAEAVGVDVT